MIDQGLKKVLVGGAMLHYIDQGCGVPVIFVHGIIQDYRTWEAQRTAFSKDFRFISYSRRYHYPNEWKDDGSAYSDLAHAEDLAKLIQTLDLAPAHIVGCSSGAWVALLFALNHPKLVRTLVLNEAGIIPWLANIPEGKPHYQSYMSAIESARPFFRAKDLEGGLRTAIEIFWGEGVYDQMSDDVRTGALDNAHVVKAAAFSKNMFSSFTTEDARQINSPALLVEGKETMPPFTLINGELERWLPNQKKAIIPDAGHLMHLDHPEEYNRVVLEFLSRH